MNGRADAETPFVIRHLKFFGHSDLLSFAIMSNAIPLTPGFSPVTTGKIVQNRFNGFPRADKPLKRLACRHARSTRLKPGVGESD